MAKLDSFIEHSRVQAFLQKRYSENKEGFPYSCSLNFLFKSLDVLFEISEIAVSQKDLFEIEIKNGVEGGTWIVNIPLLSF